MASQRKAAKAAAPDPVAAPARTPSEFGEPNVFVYRGGHRPVRSFACTESPHWQPPTPEQWEAGEGPTATENREVQVHTGGGLTAREVVAFAAGRFTQDASWGASENGRCDVVLWEGGMIVGLVLNAHKRPEWFDGRSVALALAADDRELRIERVEAGGRKRPGASG